jgi:hypothetical protein
MPKGSVVNTQSHEQDGSKGILVTAFFPFSDFSAEKEGSKYQDKNGEEQQATPHRDLKTRFTNPELVWPDGKIRQLAIQLKANNPMLPEEFEQRKNESVARTAATALKRLSAADRAKVLADLDAELDAEPAA